MNKVNIENCYYLFKLDDLIKTDNNIINKLIRNTNTDFKVIQRLITGDIVRFYIL